MYRYVEFFGVEYGALILDAANVGLICSLIPLFNRLHRRRAHQSYIGFQAAASMYGMRCLVVTIVSRWRPGGRRKVALRLRPQLRLWLQQRQRQRLRLLATTPCGRARYPCIRAAARPRVAPCAPVLMPPAVVEHALLVQIAHAGWPMRKGSLRRDCKRHARQKARRARINGLGRVWLRYRTARSQCLNTGRHRCALNTG